METFCNSMDDVGPCSINKPQVTMEMAGAMVGLDLTQPIDCSQMQISCIQAMPIPENYSRRTMIERETILMAYVFNDLGEREELEITFKLKSQRMPKTPQQK